MKKIKIAVLPGDGIGEEVMRAALPVLEALNIPVELNFGKIGWNCWIDSGNPVPSETWELISSCDATLLGATTSKPEREAIEDLPQSLRLSPPKYISPIVQLRQKLDLFANIRPCYNVKGKGNNFNFVVIRENTEGLYAGLDYYPLNTNLANVIRENPRWSNVKNDEAACSLRLQTQIGLERLFEFAFKYAEEKHFNKVTFADKPNVLRESSKYARSIFENVAKKYPNIIYEIHNIDAVGLWIVKRPQDFGVIVAENMFGDILSDVGAGVMGGLGFAPSANIGINGCYFEPVHGSAPRITKNTGNPSAMFLTIGLLLEHFGFYEQSNQIKRAVHEVVKSGRHLTYDLGGKATTDEMAKSIIEHCLHPSLLKRISFLATGNEIVYGEVQDTNTSLFAKSISEKGGSIFQRMSVSDDKSEISSALEYLLDHSDAVIVTGGLGPTTDDTTRFAIAEVTKSKLYFNNLAWQHIENRLSKFDLPINDSNKQQALFPEGSTIYQNEFGTACGSNLEWNNKQIFMLPGPPRECRNMFDKNVIGKLEQSGFLYKTKIHRWLTLGLLEGEIAPIIDKISKLYEVEISYKWAYPYLEVKLISARDEAVDELTFKIDNLLFDYLISKDGRDAVEIFIESSKSLNDKIFVSHPIENLNLYYKDKLSNIEFISPEHPSTNDNTLYFFISENRSNQNVYTGKITLNCAGYTYGKLIHEHTISFPNRGPEVEQFSNAYIAWQTNKFIQTLGNKI